MKTGNQLRGQVQITNLMFLVLGVAALGLLLPILQQFIAIQNADPNTSNATAFVFLLVPTVAIIGLLINYLRKSNPETIK